MNLVILILPFLRLSLKVFQIKSEFVNPPSVIYFYISISSHPISQVSTSLMFITYFTRSCLKFIFLQLTLIPVSRCVWGMWRVSLRSKHTLVHVVGLVVVMCSQRFLLPVRFHSFTASHLLFCGILVVDFLCIFHM